MILCSASIVAFPAALFHCQPMRVGEILKMHLGESLYSNGGSGQDRELLTCLCRLAGFVSKTVSLSVRKQRTRARAIESVGRTSQRRVRWS